MQSYGKPEENELIRRKTFYDLVGDLIDNIKTTKEEKTIKTIEDKYLQKNNNKYGIINKKDEKKNSDNNLNNWDNSLNKKIELSGILEKVKLRKSKEKQKRNKINNILFRCDIRIKNIDDSANKIKNINLKKVKKIIKMMNQ